MFRELQFPKHTLARPTNDKTPFTWCQLVARGIHPRAIGGTLPSKQKSVSTETPLQKFNQHILNLDRLRINSKCL